MQERTKAAGPAHRAAGPADAVAVDALARPIEVVAGGAGAWHLPIATAVWHIRRRRGQRSCRDEQQLRKCAQERHGAYAGRPRGQDNEKNLHAEGNRSRVGTPQAIDQPRRPRACQRPIDSY